MFLLFIDKVFPICLPETKDMHHEPKDDVEEKEFVISAWSKSGPGMLVDSIESKKSLIFFFFEGALDIKHQATVYGIKDSECDNKYRRYKRMLSPSQYCVVGEEEKDISCYGDGPIMAMDDSKHWYVSGILSYGAPCGKKGWPDVVTRVSSYKDWIINVCTSDYDK